MLDELVHKPVRKKAVYDRMLNEIRQAIRSGQLPPRSRILSEPELCERYCISRVSVRTALAKLEKDGLIVKKNGLGSDIAVFPLQGRFDLKRLPLPYRLIMKIKIKDIAKLSLIHI